MIDAIFRPVHQWPKTPTPSYKRKAATFRAPYSATLDLLENEFSKLRAKDIVIQTMPISLNW